MIKNEFEEQMKVAEKVRKKNGIVLDLLAKSEKEFTQRMYAYNEAYAELSKNSQARKKVEND